MLNFITLPTTRGNQSIEQKLGNVHLLPEDGWVEKWGGGSTKIFEGKEGVYEKNCTS